MTAEQREAVVDRLGPDPLRADADPDPGLGPDPPQPGPDRRAADGPVRAGRHRQRLPRRGAVPAPGRPAAAGHTLRRSQFEAMWDDLVVLMADGVRTGRIDTVHAEHTPEAMGRPPRVRRPRGRGLRLPPPGRAVPRLRHTGAHRGARGRNLFWCPRCQPDLPVPRPWPDRGQPRRRRDGESPMTTDVDGVRRQPPPRRRPAGRRGRAVRAVEPPGPPDARVRPERGGAAVRRERADRGRPVRRPAAAAHRAGGADGSRQPAARAPHAALVPGVPARVLVVVVAAPPSLLDGRRVGGVV